MTERPDEVEVLVGAGRTLWRGRDRWIDSSAALREEDTFTDTVHLLKSRNPTRDQVIGWIRSLFKEAPTGPDCPAIAIALHLLPRAADDQALRYVFLPLLSLKGARFDTRRYRRSGELHPPEDDAPTWPVTLMDVVVPAVALSVVDALRGIEPPALGQVLRWVNGYWTQHELVLEGLAELINDLAKAGDAPHWRPGESIAPPWALELLAARSPAASAALSVLADQVKRGQEERSNAPPTSSNGNSQSRLRKFAPSTRVVELTDSQRLACDAMLSSLTTDDPRSVLVVAPSGAGRTTVTSAVACALHDLGTAVFVAAPSDISGGAVYTNELDGRLNAVVDELGSGVWIVPDADRMSSIGRHSESSDNLADRITSPVASGRVRLVAELTPDGYRRLQRESPSFVRECTVVRLHTPGSGELEAIAQATFSQASLALNRPSSRLAQKTLSLGVDICRDLLPHLEQPAAIARLVGSVAATLPDGVAPRSQDLYAAVSTLTGLPRDLIDPTRSFDVGDFRERLSTQVLGQQAAVDAFVERVALFKAGMCGRDRPIAVFLLVGPTGTGKTKLARSLAREFFGSDDRLIRIDMSELDWSSGSRRLFGGGDAGRGTSLVDQIRDQPLSALLLDEFDKAPPDLWDSFLSLFDTGYLTDRLGRRVDCRQTFIIATANFGASSASRGAVGFANDERRTFDASELMRAVRKALRPELINRFDRIVEFQPLTRETMREIVGHELEDLAGRRGLSRHGWTIDVDESALDFIVDRAFTKEDGARPARRTVEQLVAAPIAVEIAMRGVSGTARSIRVSASDEQLDIRFGSQKRRTGPRATANERAVEPPHDEVPRGTVREV